jgi:signal transduction histidine kinase
LSDYVEITNFIVYQEEEGEIKLIYQSNWHHSKAINYSLIINSLTTKYRQTSIELNNSFSCLEEDCYHQWFQQQNINYLSILSLNFQEELLGKVFLEIEQLKYSESEVKYVLKIVNQYLAIYCYHQKLRKVEANLTAEAQQLLKIKEEQSKYLSHMNHELRTPIAAVIGFAKMLQQRLYGELNAKQAQYIDAIYQSGTYLLELISDLLDISKIQAQKEELFKEKILVNELCESALALVKTKAEEQGLELNLIISSDIETCFVDQRRLKQVLVNLLSNAVKFTEEGSVTLEVTKDDRYLFFKIIDTGIGIDEQAQRQLFQPFSQLNTPLHRKHRGTGLGLVISRELTRLHGGDIRLTSEPNKGTCFTVYIPRGSSQKF